MKKSKLLAASEAVDGVLSRVPDLDGDADKFIQLRNGVYEVEEIQCTGDYVAIAPFPRSGVTEGGIVVPMQADALSDIGLVVGLGTETGNLLLGERVKFIPRHKAADLTEQFEVYGKAEIAIYKLASIVAILPNVPVRQVTRKADAVL